MKATEVIIDDKLLYFEIRTDKGSGIGASFANETPLNGDAKITLKDAEANARLWAAAPDLLEALKIMTKAFDDSNKNYPDWIPTRELNEAYDYAITILKKVYGA